MQWDRIAERDFTSLDQERFAAFSGDRNPMHMDAIAARRTLAGQPVVHGVHTLLWVLDSLFKGFPDLGSVKSFKATFEKMVYVGERVQAVLVERHEKQLRARVLVEGMSVLQLQVFFGESDRSVFKDIDDPIFYPEEPLSPSFQELTQQRGQIPFQSSREDVKRLFPSLFVAFGYERVAALCCSSFLVGMVCPGLYSIYQSLNLTATPNGNIPSDRLHFDVVRHDARFGLVRMDVFGAGWTGSIDAYARPAPTAQASLPHIASRITVNEFSDDHVLIIGGSRGLGEVIAKAVAAGGASVTLTYSLGEADACSVQREIISFGGKCDVIHYDVKNDAIGQLQPMQKSPSHVYYLATPPIWPRKHPNFSRDRFQTFVEFYITGFYNLWSALSAKYKDGCSFFYPSSVAVEARPDHTTEYAMAKAAAEVLCTDLQSSKTSGKIIVRRLPRLPTDQTASLFKVEAIDPLDVLLPIIREVQAS